MDLDEKIGKTYSAFMNSQIQQVLTNDTARKELYRVFSGKSKTDQIKLKDGTVIQLNPRKQPRVGQLPSTRSFLERADDQLRRAIASL